MSSIQWSEKRIEAWKRYINTDITELAQWERRLNVLEKDTERARSMVESKKKSIEAQILELEEQGVKFQIDQ